METSRELTLRTIRVALAVAAMAVVGASIGCQTTKGVGRDIENLGDNIEDTAEAND